MFVFTVSTVEPNSFGSFCSTFNHNWARLTGRKRWQGESDLLKSQNGITSEVRMWLFLNLIRLPTSCALSETHLRCDFLRLQQPQQASSPSAGGVTDLSTCACHTGVVCVCVPAVTPCFHGDCRATPPTRIAPPNLWNVVVKPGCLTRLWLRVTVASSSSIIWRVGLEVQCGSSGLQRNSRSFLRKNKHFVRKKHFI